MSWQALARKEFKEHVRPAGKWSGMLIASLALSVFFGIGATVGFGYMFRDITDVVGAGPGLSFTVFITMMVGLVGATFSAVMIPMNLGVDAIAGERERHTLETLLAGPLSDKAILWAKAVAVVAVAVLVSAFGGAAVWLTLVFLYAQYGLLWGLLAIPMAAAATLVPAFIFTCFAFVFSTRAKTVKDAGQKMGYVMIPMFMMPGLSITLSSASTLVTILAVSFMAVVSLTMAILFPILAFVRFRRDRLLV